MKFWLAFIFVVGSKLLSQGQDTLKVSGDSAIRTNGLIIDLGLNSFHSPTSEFSLNPLSSRGVNFYFMHKINPTSKHFIARIGAGFGLDNYAFDKDISPVPFLDSTEFIQGNSVGIDSIDFIKSKISINHIDIPIEIMFVSNKRSGAFKFALGVRPGWVFDVHTKRVTKVDGQKLTEKIKADFNIQRARFGIYSRLMYSGFNFFFMHNLTPLFQKNRGPELSSFMAGLSIVVD